MFVSPQDRKSAQHRIHSNAIGTTKFTRETVVSHHCRLTLFFKSHVKAVVNIQTSCKVQLSLCLLFMLQIVKAIGRRPVHPSTVIFYITDFQTSLFLLHLSFLKLAFSWSALAYFSSPYINIREYFKSILSLQWKERTYYFWHHVPFGRLRRFENPTNRAGMRIYSCSLTCRPHPPPSPPFLPPLSHSPQPV